MFCMSGLVHFLQMTPIIQVDLTVAGWYGPNVFSSEKLRFVYVLRNISCETRTLSDCEDVRGSGVPAGWPTLSHNGGEPLFSLVSARSLQYGQHQSHGIKKRNKIREDFKKIILTFAQSVQIHWQFHIRWTGYCLISFAKHGKFVPGRKLLNYFWNISNSIFVQGESRIALLYFWSLWNSIFVRGEPSLHWLHFFFLLLDGCQRSLGPRMPNQI